jgi:heat shock protein HslJ
MMQKIVSIRAILIKAGYLLSVMGITITFSFALLGCTNFFSNQISVPSNITLKNSSWQLEAWKYNHADVRLIPQTKILLNFKDNEVDGFSGCNSFGGSFKLVKEQLSFGTFKATQKGCNTAVMNQESQLLSSFQSIRRIHKDASGRLVVDYTYNQIEGVLYFKPIK